jgi:hypothetical protein
MENKILRHKLAPYQNLIDLIDMYTDGDDVSHQVFCKALHRSKENIAAVCTINEDDDNHEDDGLTGAEVKLQSVRKCGNCVHYQPLIENDVDGVPEACQLDPTLKPECNYTVCTKHKFGIRRD